uniref:NECAP endocytosis associated 2 n=1 Tax=Naja naja TaxID=35670 RepID=A0A8C6XTL6_NAJNA
RHKGRRGRGFPFPRLGSDGRRFSRGEKASAHARKSPAFRWGPRWRKAKTTSPSCASSRRCTSTGCPRAPPTAATGELFAQASVEQFPSIAVEGVTDSSRYFVIRVEDGNGRRAFIGIGFVDRGDAFDFNVALQDHFKWVKQQDELAKEAQNPTQGPKLDLGFKEGQTIKLSIANMKKKDGSSGSRSRTADSTGLPLLPPPPGGKAPFLPTPGEQLPLPLLGPQQMPPKQMLPGLGPHSRQVLQEKLLQTSGEISPKLLGPALSLSRTRVGSSSEQKGRPKGQGEGPLLEARDREMGSAPLALPTDPLPGWV